MPPAPLLLVLDGNSLLHRAYHAGAGERQLSADGRPIWALRGLVGYLARAAAQLRPEAVVVGFDCPEESARRSDYPGYKAHRPPKPDDLSEQITRAPVLLRDAGVCTVVPRAYEADDVLASCARLARHAGWRSVLMTSDRDAFALLDDSTSVLRIRNGGYDEAVLIDAAALAGLYGVRAGQYHDFAALRGDPSDNLAGVGRFGATRAAQLLSTFGSLEAAWQADADLVRASVGTQAAEHFLAPRAREVIERNRRLMRMRDDLPVPALDAARLPLDYLVLRRALGGCGINLGPSLWALVDGGEPPPERIASELRPWVFRSGLSGRRDPTPGQLALF